MPSLIATLDYVFSLKQHGTSVRTEVLAGCTTFLTMSYIIFVNPEILAAAGMNQGAVFVATCLLAMIGTFLTAIMANYPIAIAPGMGLNAYFAFIIVEQLGYSWQFALGAVFIAGLIFFLLTLANIRHYLIDAIPANLQIGLAAGIGLFIILIALQMGGIVVANQVTLVTLGNLASMKGAFFLMGLCLIIALERLKIPGAIMFTILIISLVSLALGDSQFYGIFSLPPSIKPTFFHLDVRVLFDWQGLTVIFTLVLICLFDSIGTTLGLIRQMALSNHAASMQRLKPALMAESIATSVGAFLGTSSATPYIESATGIRAGGRTGLTAVVVGLLFLVALLLAPLEKMVPTFAVASPLFYIGILMFKQITHLSSDDYTEIVPGFITCIMIPFSFSIASGIGLGFITYVLLKLVCGKWRDLNWTLALLAVIFSVYFVYIVH